MAARFLRVAPWDLAQRPAVWRDLALTILAGMSPVEDELEDEG